MGWALWQKKPKGKILVGFGFGPQLGKGTATQYTPIEQQFLAMYIAVLQVEPLRKEKHFIVKTSLSKGGLRICSIDPLLWWLKSHFD